MLRYDALFIGFILNMFRDAMKYFARMDGH